VNILKANILGLAIASLSYAQDAATLVHAAPAEATYADVLNEVKKEGYSLESASKDAGIKTTIQVTGHYKQTGSHLEITFTSENGHTTVRVTQMEQHRYKALKTEPWGDTKINTASSQDAAEKLKAGLGW
jgi:hypothetical protein